jgi:phosphoribosylformylglycinamidine synthase
VADGGLAVAVAEMVAASAIGARADVPDDVGALFGESPDRVLVCLAPAAVEAVRARAATAGVAVHDLGEAGGGRLRIGAVVDLPVEQVVSTWRDRLPSAFGTAVTH